MIEHQVTVFDHSSDAGYHFRENPSDQNWAKLVRDENNVVRSLNDTAAIDGRIRIVPAGEYTIMILASTRIRSGGRTAIRTVSLKSTSHKAPIRWKQGLQLVLRQYLEGDESGGSVAINAQDATLPPSIQQYLPASRFSRNASFFGLDVDSIMAFWSHLPPLTRSQTEIIVGAVTDVDRDQHDASGDQILWIVEPNAQVSFPNPQSDVRQYHLAPHEQNEHVLERSASIADQTGVSGNLWLRTFESEMSRRGHDVNHADHLEIRLHLCNHDKDIDRRTMWRTLALDTLREDPAKHSEYFFLHGDPLAAHEMEGWELEDQLESLRPRIMASKSLHESGEFLRFAAKLHPYADSRLWVQILQYAPLESWLQSNHETIMAAFRPALMGDSGFGLHLLQSVHALNSPAKLGPAVYRLLNDANMILPNAWYRYIRHYPSLKFSKGTYTSQASDKTLLHTPKGTFNLNWEHPLTLATSMAKLHKEHFEEEEIIRAIEEFSKSQEDLLEGYLAEFQRLYDHNLASISSRIAVSAVLSLHQIGRPGTGPWLDSLFQVSTEISEIKKVLSELNVDVDDLPDIIIQRIYSNRANKKVRSLKGYPTPFYSTIKEDPQEAYVRLTFSPKITERLWKMVATPLLRVIAICWLVVYIPRVIYELYVRIYDGEIPDVLLQESVVGSNFNYWLICGIVLALLVFLRRIKRRQIQHIWDGNEPREGLNDKAN